MKSNITVKVGETVYGKTGNGYRLKSVLGSGSQGVAFEEESGKYVVKIYYAAENHVLNEAFLERISFLQGIELPSNFVSIVDIITSPCVGYVMERVVGYKPLNKYLIQPKDESFSAWYNSGYGFRERLFIGYVIAKAFSEMEVKNLSYCDISGNNILTKVAKGIAVKMIDIDNIYIAGKSSASIIGTPRYIAPEVIARTHNPDILSDNYSLAVILFELLRIGHPYISDEVLAGSPDDEEKAFAGQMNYVDSSNSTNMLPEDVVFTERMKELFRRCFIEGKNNRMLRPSAKEYYYAFLDASNKIIKCPHCGAWHYPRRDKNGYAPCPWCDGESKPKARMNFYDVLYESNTHGDQKKTLISRSLKNSYILRDGEKNKIKNYYLYGADTTNNRYNLSDDYVTVAKTDEGYYLLNEYNKMGIKVKRAKTHKTIAINPGKYILLESGDEIYFEFDSKEPKLINLNDQTYTFLKMARFMEE